MYYLWQCLNSCSAILPNLQGNIQYKIALDPTQPLPEYLLPKLREMSELSSQRFVFPDIFLITNIIHVYQSQVKDICFKLFLYLFYLYKWSFD